jgi:putative Mn2+ efflux pump MntP
MTLFELLLIALALSLDAFAVALSCGMRLPSNRTRKFFKIALVFGLFQAVMPLLGSLLSKYLLARYIARYSGLLSFVVFALLAGKTFYDFFTAHQEEAAAPCVCDSNQCLLSLGIATSIDAFLIGSVLGLKAVSLPVAVAWIGAVTFLNSLIGCFLGNRLAGFLARYSRLLAGVILAALAVRALF